MFGNVLGKFKNNPFNQTVPVLERDFENLIKIIEGNEADEMIDLFIEAFSYFCGYPEDYDGASGDEESGAEKSYDIPSIIHDYLSTIGLDSNYKLLRLSDKLYINHMKALHFNSLQIGKRKIGLFLLAPLRFVRRKYMLIVNCGFKNAVAVLDINHWTERLVFENSILE